MTTDTTNDRGILEKAIIQSQEDEIRYHTLIKIRYEAKLAKWQFYTYWLMFGMSIAAFIISVVTLIIK
jgi:hypothetical protein